jgi:nucleoside 2-deoxyribosyltransferase
MKTIYLAGCDVFAENAHEYYERLKDLCDKYGFVGLSPFDVSNSFTGKKFSQEHSEYIFGNNVCLIRDCDIVIANIIPFRGACVDDGTAMEIGLAFGLQKTIYGYTPFANDSLETITNVFYPNYRNTPYPVLEVFNNNPVNLMIYEAIDFNGGKIFQTFEQCLVDIKKRHDDE